MPRAPKPRPLAEYQAHLARILRQMEGDARVPLHCRQLVGEALQAVTKLLVPVDDTPF